MNRVKRIALTPVAALCVCCVRGTAAWKPQRTAERVAAWLWAQQLPNGAIASCFEGDGEVYVNPYFSAEAAMALLGHDASERSLARIQRYFDWHFAHLNTAAEDANGVDGTICDYDVTVENGAVVAERSRGSYDSTDSYAALFLTAPEQYARVGGDADYLVSHRADIDRVTAALHATLENGYTYARPDYREFYLMDNCEVYAGLASAERLYRGVLTDAAAADRLQAEVARFKRRFAVDWLSGDHYRPSLGADEFSWDEFYQSAASQAFPVLYGLSEPTDGTARAIYRRFCERWRWYEMSHLGSGASEYYWGHLLLWGVRMGDADNAAAYLLRFELLTADGLRYPLYCGDAAMILTACDLLSAAG